MAWRLSLHDDHAAVRLARAHRERELGDAHVLRLVNDDRVVQRAHPTVNERQEDHVREVDGRRRLHREFHRAQRRLADHLYRPALRLELFARHQVVGRRHIDQRLNLVAERNPRIDLARFRVQPRYQRRDLLGRARRQRLLCELDRAQTILVDLHARHPLHVAEPEPVQRARFDRARVHSSLQLVRDALIERSEQHALVVERAVSCM